MRCARSPTCAPRSSDGVRGHVPAGVEVRPTVDDAPLARLVASATCLVHPARSEGFGYPPLEAMAAGTPVVTTDGGALPEIVGDAAVVVPAGDAAGARPRRAQRPRRRVAGSGGSSTRDAGACATRRSTAVAAQGGWPTLSARVGDGR